MCMYLRIQLHVYTYMDVYSLWFVDYIWQIVEQYQQRNATNLQ